MCQYFICLLVYCISSRLRVCVCKALVLFTSVSPGPSTMFDTFIMWMNNFVAKSSENSQSLTYSTAWQYWRCWVLPLVWNTFFLLAFDFSHYCSYSSGPFLSVSFAGFSSPAHPLNVGVSYFLPCQHFFTLCILSLEVLVNPNGFNYYLSLSFSDLHPWSVSFTLERYIHLPVGMSFSINLLKNEHFKLCVSHLIK